MLGKWSRVSQRSLPLLKLRLGPGWALGLFRWGWKVRVSASRGCRDKVDHWEPAALRIQPGRKLGVKRDAAGGAVGLDVKLERGRKAQGCATAHMLESQLCFVLLPIPHLFQRGKRINLVPRYPLFFLKMYLWVLMGEDWERKKNRCTTILSSVILVNSFVLTTGQNIGNVKICLCICVNAAYQTCCCL